MKCLKRISSMAFAGAAHKEVHRNILPADRGSCNPKRSLQPRAKALAHSHWICSDPPALLSMHQILNQHPKQTTRSHQPVVTNHINTLGRHALAPSLAAFGVSLRYDCIARYNCYTVQIVSVSIFLFLFSYFVADIHHYLLSILGYHMYGCWREPLFCPFLLCYMETTRIALCSLTRCFFYPRRWSAPNEDTNSSTDEVLEMICEEPSPPHYRHASVL